MPWHYLPMSQLDKVLKCYVAAPSTPAGVARAKLMIRKLRELGIMVTYDWTETVEKHGPGNDGTISDETARVAALQDIGGVALSDFVVILTGDNTRGMWIEYGMALAFGKGIHVSGPQRKTLFSHVPIVTMYETDEEIVTKLKEAIGEEALASATVEPPATERPEPLPLLGANGATQESEANAALDDQITRSFLRT